MKRILLLTVFFVFIVISCKKASDYKDNGKLCLILEEMVKRDQKYRSKIDNETSNYIKDSLMTLQKDLDYKNSKFLIEIIDNRGWPKKENLNCKNFGSPMLIFRHAPKEFFEEILKIIDKELDEGRLDGLSHAFIKDHLNGRPGLSFQIIEDK